MKRYIILRVGKAVLTIWAVYTLVFFLTRVTGDPIEWLTLAGASDSAKEILRTNLGLDMPLWQQYIKSFVGLFTGDTGMSYYYARSVSDLFAERMIPTISLGSIVLGLTIVIGIPLGVLAAVKHNTLLDRITMSSAVVGSTLPNFILGILLIFIFSLKLRILPSGGIGTPQHFLMPVIALSVGPIANVARLTRSSLLDVIGQEHLDCARAKGHAGMEGGLKAWPQECADPGHYDFGSTVKCYDRRICCCGNGIRVARDRNLNCFQCTAARFSCGSIWRSGDIGFRNICESFGRPFLWFAGSANTRSLKDFR